MSYKDSADYAQKLIVKFISERMDELGTTQYALAKELGVSESTISRFLSGSSSPSLTLFLQILGALDLHPYLIPAEMDQTEFQMIYHN